MPKLPQVRPEEVIRALQRLGFAEDRQVGSHKIMVKRTSDGRKLSVPVPMHKGKKRSVLARYEVYWTSPGLVPMSF